MNTTELRNKAIEQMIDLSREIAKSDPLPDFGLLDIEEARKLTAYSLMEFLENLNTVERYAVLAATCLHLNVENFILHHKILSKSEDETNG